MTRKKVEEPKNHILLAIDPSFEGFAWCAFHINKEDEQATARLLECKAFNSIKSTKENKYALLREEIRDQVCLLEDAYFSVSLKVHRVVYEEQFKKNMMMISGCVACSFDPHVKIANVQEKYRMQPKSIRKIVAGSGVISDKDDVKSFLEEKLGISTKDWTDDVRDAYMVGLAFLKTMYNISPEDVK